MAHPLPQRRSTDFVELPHIRWVPWPVMASTIVIAAYLTASTCVVVISNNEVVESWKIPPAVLLAIFSSILGFALNSMLAIGVSITFALSVRKHSNVSQLHYIWAHSQITSLISCLKAGPNARRTALTAILVYVAQFINNPLLQRSTHQAIQDSVSEVTMKMDLATTIPDGWGGTILDASLGDIIGSRNGLWDTQQWWLNNTMSTQNKDGYSCNGTCTGYVRGAGINASCWTTVTGYLDLSNPSTSGSYIFIINSTVSQNSTGSPFLRLSTLYSSAISDSCVATLVSEICDINNGIVEYPLTIQNTTVSLRYDELDNITVLAETTNTGDLLTAPPNSGAGPLQALNDFYGGYIGGNANITFNQVHKAWIYVPSSMFVDFFFQADPESYNNNTFPKCAYTWMRPAPYIIKAMHEFMLRAALRVGNGTETQTFNAQYTWSTLVFHSDIRFLVSAIVIVLVAFLALMTLWWHWWWLSWPVTLSPLETARALGAPILPRMGPIDAILAEVGDNPVGPGNPGNERSEESHQVGKANSDDTQAEGPATSTAQQSSTQMNSNELSDPIVTADHSPV
ncbi:hypothetical protein V8E54_011459 [Elaphomyces granulatus]